MGWYRMSETPKLVWVVPEIEGGIQNYSATLWPAVRGACAVAGIETFEPMVFPQRDLNLCIGRLEKLGPTLIHVQHEYGLFGGKVAPFYRFPSWVRKVKRRLPEVKIVATGHTVLDSSYRYPVS